MPPCSWIDSWLTWRQASAILDLRRGHDARRARGIALGVDRRAGEARHRLRLLVLDRHVDHPVLQRLERADRHAELLARLQVLERRVVGGLDRADRFGADQRGGEVDDFLDQRQRASAAPISASRRDADARRSATSAARVPSSVRSARERDARRVALDEEQADAVGIAVAARGARRHDQQVGAGAVRDRALLAVEIT